MKIKDKAQEKDRNKAMYNKFLRRGEYDRSKKSINKRGY